MNDSREYRFRRMWVQDKGKNRGLLYILGNYRLVIVHR